MNITIGKPCGVSEKGGRLNNEDFIYPLPETVTSGQKLFLVCDGVGGAEKGEVASCLACESFSSYFSTFHDEDIIEDIIRKAIQYTEARFDDYVVSHPSAKGMATTLTMFYRGTKGVALAHVGDSRIYQFREGKIIYRTEDHSLVNSLLKLGQISLEEAKKHPQRNVILRAIQSSGQPTEADVVVLQDIQPEDYFFMCTDGVLEHYSNESLAAVFERCNSPEEIKKDIMETCYGRTRDNFSFYIIPVNNVHEVQSVKQNILSFLYSFA